MHYRKIFLVLLSSFFLIACSKEGDLNIQHWKTSNGAAVYFVRAPQLPIIDLSIAFQAGSARDDNAPGLAQMTNALLDEGSNNLDANAIAQAFDQSGAIYSNHVDRDMGVVSLRSLIQDDQLETAINTFTTVLSGANFPKDAFIRIQQQMLSALAARSQSPSAIVEDAFYQRIYGEHPYAHRVLGNSASISKITRDDVQNFYQHYYVAKNATVVIVGDVTRSHAKRIAEAIMKPLPSGSAAQPLPLAPNNKSMDIEVIHYPSEQTHIRLGEVGINWHDPDFFPLYVGNYTLGAGSLVSRLFLTVRQEHGLSYNVYSQLTPLAANGPFLVGLQTNNAKAAQAIAYTQSTIADFVKNGPTAAELKAAKQNLIGGFPLRLDSNENIAQAVMLIGFYHLPKDFLTTFQDKVAKVTQKQVKKAFEDQINLNTLVTVTVGQTPQPATAAP